MFDDLLDKEGFVARLKEAGLSEEEILAEWNKLLDEFYRQCMVVVHDELTEEERAKLSLGEDFKSDIDKLKDYVKDNAANIDRNKIFNLAATRARDNYLRYLEPSGGAGE